MESEMRKKSIRTVVIKLFAAALQKLKCCEIVLFKSNIILKSFLKFGFG
jgi:hypothetical protein